MSLKVYLTTKQFAQTVGVQGATVRRSLCVNGHYLGIKPEKLPNNRLVWPGDKINEILQIGQQDNQ